MFSIAKFKEKTLCGATTIGATTESDCPTCLCPKQFTLMLAVRCEPNTSELLLPSHFLRRSSTTLSMYVGNVYQGLTEDAVFLVVRVRHATGSMLLRQD